MNYDRAAACRLCIYWTCFGRHKFLGTCEHPLGEERCRDRYETCENFAEKPAEAEGMLQ